MFDVTDVPGPPVGVDDEFVLLGEQGSRADHGSGSGAGPHHELVGGRDHDFQAPSSGVPCLGRSGWRPDARVRGGCLARIELWNGDICELEVDAIVNAANVSLWMSTGVGRRDQASRRRLDRVRCGAAGPRGAGRIDRDAGREARRQGRHPCRVARSGPPDQRDGHRARRPERDGPGARDRAPRASPSRRWAPASAAFRSTRRPSSTVKAVRDELPRSPGIEHVIFAMRGAAAYQAFEVALARTATATPRSPSPHAGAGERRRRVSLPYEPTEEQRDELVEQVAREIQLRGLTGPAVHFLQASRPYRPLGANAMLFFDPVLRGLFGGGLRGRLGDPRRRRGDRAADRPARRTRRRNHLGRLAVAARARVSSVVPAPLGPAGGPTGDREINSIADWPSPWLLGPAGGPTGVWHANSTP